MKDCGQCIFSKVSSTDRIEFKLKQGAQLRLMGA